MNHDEAIDAVLSLLRPTPRSDDVGEAARATAQEHIARCADCWRLVARIHDLAMGEPPPEAATMEQLYGCDGVRDQLHLLVGLDAREIEQKNPETARHLSWCVACRERLAALFLTELASEPVSIGMPIETTRGWRTFPTAGGEQLRELVGTALVRLRQGLAAFADLPEGWLVQAPLPVFAWRGDAREGEAAVDTLAREVRVVLEAQGLTVTLGVDAHGTERADLEVTTGGPSEGVSLQLRLGRGNEQQLVAADTVRAGEPAGFRGLVPGAYTLDIVDRPRRLRFRIGFDLQLDT